jgi:predicted O-methyltransferase YrrM
METRMDSKDQLARWTNVDECLERALVPRDAQLEAIVQACIAAKLPDIAVTPTQGRLLTLLAMVSRAKTVLEVGTLGGLSTVCLARGVAPGGKVVTLEVDPHHARVAQENFVKTGVAGMIDLRIGPAIETLPGVAKDYANFDLVFIDADKPNNPAYLAWARKLTKPGSIIVVDNVVRHGAIVDDHPDASTQGALEALRLLGNTIEYFATAAQTIGRKGHDGFAIAIAR